MYPLELDSTTLHLIGLWLSVMVTICYKEKASWMQSEDYTSQARPWRRILFKYFILRRGLIKLLRLTLNSNPGCEALHVGSSCLSLQSSWADRSARLLVSESSLLLILLLRGRRDEQKILLGSSG